MAGGNTPRVISTAEKDSFAFYTVTVRFPQIFDSLINSNDFSPPKRQRLLTFSKTIPDGELELIKATNRAAELVNKNIVKKGYTWKNGPFIGLEQYFYHKLLELGGYYESRKDNKPDFFSVIKNRNVLSKKDKMIETIGGSRNLFYGNDLRESAGILLNMTLGGNLADLSQINELTKNPVELLLDDTEKFLKGLPRYIRVDIILDNSGEELFADLLFAKWLVQNAGVKNVFLHFKAAPYFVSDATINDYRFLAETLRDGGETGADFIDDLDRLIKSENIQLCKNECWTDYVDYKRLPSTVMEDLNRSSLLVFKGDLNYRKLVGDYHWEYSTKTTNILNYLKTDVLILRVLKSEVVTGLAPEITARFSDTSWLTSGKYGIIEHVPACLQIE
jgi:hypothetical protein